MNKSQLHNTKKIIWMHSHFLYWMGGTKFIFEVIKRINKKNKVVVIVENSSVQASLAYKDAGIELISLGKSTSTSILYWLFFPLNILKDYLMIKKILNNHNLNTQNSIVITSMFPMNYISYVLKLNYSQYCFEPFAFFHDNDFIANFNKIKRIMIQILAFIYKRFDIIATRNAKFIFTLNNTTKEIIYKVYGKKSIVTYAGIDSRHFSPHVSAPIKNMYKNKSIIVHSTDYSPVKGTERMIRIFSDVKKLVPNTILLITSTLDNRNEKLRLKNLATEFGISKSVKFLGFVDYKLLPEIYSLSKVIVQCSYSTMSGTTSMALPVKEAMSCGTPAIRYPILNEDVTDGQTGYLVDPRDTNEMISKIVKILTMSKQDYNVFSKKARRDIINKYNWEYTTDIILNKISKII